MNTKISSNHKIHKMFYSFGSYSLCGRTAYSPDNINEKWKGVNCKACLRVRFSQNEVQKR